MQRVLVIGSPGAGKSTFAENLARRTGLPLIHLDRHYWRAGWTEPDKAQWRRQVAKLTEQERWVMDGNYGGTLDLRLKRADTVILLDVPALTCVARVLRRVVRNRGQSRPDMADGCPERLSPSFLLFILRYPFTSRRNVAAKLERFTGRRLTLKNNAQVEQFLASLGDHR